MAARYAEYFPQFIKQGVGAELLDERLLQFDLAALGAALKAERDLQFDYLGLQTLYDRYFLHIDERAHRAAAGVLHARRDGPGAATRSTARRARSSSTRCCRRFDFMSSTPTLFNAGTRRSQLSSCYLTTVADDLDGIYEALKENALLSKFAGGLGNDWTNVRALGSHIKGTNGKSQGVVPFLKVVNDTAVAVNQGGKRKGAVCAYLETWHLDIEEFLELRKNTGDDRRRTHDMNTANWMPDLFMKRVMEGGEWTLFSPSTCPDLHDKFGRAFEDAYTALRGQGGARRDQAVQEDQGGRPVAQDADRCCSRPAIPGSRSRTPATCARRSSTSASSTRATCAPRSRSTPAPTRSRSATSARSTSSQHVADGKLDQAKLKKTVATAMRMLDNVIDINYYAVKKARDSNLRHRPVGLGIMGFQDALHELRVPYASEEAVEFADRSMEAVCYHAYWASTELAEERGRYSSYRGSLWDRGILPHRHARPARRAARHGGYRARSTAARRSTGTRCAARIKRARHAQLELRRDRADGDDLQHRRRQRRRSSRPSATCRSSPTCRASSPSSTSTWCAT